MRTTFIIDDDLMERVRRKAAATGKTITQIVSDALSNEVANEAQTTATFVLEWTPVAGSPAPEVDLADRDSLYDRMEHGE